MFKLPSTPEVGLEKEVVLPADTLSEKVVHVKSCEMELTRAVGSDLLRAICGGVLADPETQTVLGDSTLVD